KQEIIPSLKAGIYSQLLMDLSYKSNDLRMWVDVPNSGTL
ncbi:MAG: oxidoreductase, partial [Dolichospermum sp.]